MYKSTQLPWFKVLHSSHNEVQTSEQNRIYKEEENERCIIQSNFKLDVRDEMN